MRPPRVLTRSFPLMSAVFTANGSVQLSGFNLFCSLTPAYSLYTISVRQTRVLPPPSFRGSAPLGIPPRDGHPWLWLYPSRCRADSGLSPVRTCARRAHKKRARRKPPRQNRQEGGVKVGAEIQVYQFSRQEAAFGIVSDGRTPCRYCAETGRYYVGDLPRIKTGS